MSRTWNRSQGLTVHNGPELGQAAGTTGFKSNCQHTAFTVTSDAFFSPVAALVSLMNTSGKTMLYI